MATTECEVHPPQCSECTVRSASKHVLPHVQPREWKQEHGWKPHEEDVPRTVSVPEVSFPVGEHALPGPTPAVHFAATGVVASLDVMPGTTLGSDGKTEVHVVVTSTLPRNWALDSGAGVGSTPHLVFWSFSLPSDKSPDADYGVRAAVVAQSEAHVWGDASEPRSSARHPVASRARKVAFCPCVAPSSSSGGSAPGSGGSAPGSGSGSGSGSGASEASAPGVGRLGVVATLGESGRLLIYAVPDTMVTSAVRVPSEAPWIVRRAQPWAIASKRGSRIVDFDWCRVVPGLLVTASSDGMFAVVWALWRCVACLTMPAASVRAGHHLGAG